MGSLSYVTNKGVEVVLDNYETEKTVWELYGRTGFEAPGVNYIDEQYADGSIETVAVTIPARDVTVNLIVHGKTRLQRNEVLHGIVNQIFEYGARTSWGKLKVELADETVVYLNCFYSGGLESQAETDPLTHLLSLNFHAADPYFYDTAMTQSILQDTEQSGLYLGDSVYLSDTTYLAGGALSSDIQIDNPGQLTYPVVEVHGPAKNIKIENLTSNAKMIRRLRNAFAKRRNREISIFNLGWMPWIAIRKIDCPLEDRKSQDHCWLLRQYEITGGVSCVTSPEDLRPP